MKKILIALLVLGAPAIASAQVVNADLTPGYDWCSNIDGVQDTVPAGYHAESDGTCTVLQTPVTIDMTPPGGEAVTTDTAGPGDAPVTIDLVPPARSSGSSHAAAQSDVAAPAANTITTVEGVVAASKADNPTDHIMIIIDTPTVKRATPVPQAIEVQAAQQVSAQIATTSDETNTDATTTPIVPTPSILQQFINAILSLFQ